MGAKATKQGLYDKNILHTARTLVGHPHHCEVSEILQRIFKKRDVHVCFKPHCILRQHLVRPKDEITFEEKCGVIYNIKCKNCDAEYIGETARKLGTRLNEHRKSVQTCDLKSAVSEHAKKRRPLHRLSRDATHLFNKRLLTFEPHSFPYLSQSQLWF